MGYSFEDYQRVIERSKRRNGRVNVSGFLRFVRDVLEDLQQPVIMLGPPKDAGLRAAGLLNEEPGP
jgi:hypothetical protein